MGNNWVMKVVGGVIAVVAMLGFKFWNKSQAFDEMKTQVVTLCAGDTACLTAVNTHFDDCFDQSYSMGGRNSGGSLNTPALASCINTRSGQPLFEAR